jgi:muramoyltetrapeptide carboxypeptidase
VEFSNFLGRSSRDVHWAPLQEGDIVDVIAPASKTTDAAVKGAIRFLNKWGLKPRVAKKMFGPSLFTANTDENRLRFLMDAIRAPDSKAVWCVRGGYGTNRLLPQLLREKKPSGPPKLLIGLSDITTLHAFVNQHWGWPTVHGPMLDRLGRGLTKKNHLAELHDFLFGEIPEITFSGLKPMNAAARKPGVVRGSVTGGNLITLQSLIGTRAGWRTKGRILFFEEIGEKGYRVDRALEHFRQSGHFDSAHAIVFGDFLDCVEVDGSKKLVPAALKRFAESLKIPVFSGIPSGHAPVQRPVPFETPSELYLGTKGRLVCQTGAQVVVNAPKVGSR